MPRRCLPLFFYKCHCSEYCTGVPAPGVWRRPYRERLEQLCTPAQGADVQPGDPDSSAEWLRITRWVQSEPNIAHAALGVFRGGLCTSFCPDRGPGTAFLS